MSDLQTTDPALLTIWQKVQAGERLDAADGQALFATRDLHALGAMADGQRQLRHGLKAYYSVNRHINYSNVCGLECAVCGFGKAPGSDGAYELSHDQIAAMAAAAAAGGATEVHLTGGLHPTWPLEHYEAMLTAIRQAAPALHIKAFTAVEVAHMAQLSGCTVREALARLIAAGLGSMPGGGAEIFDAAVRSRMFPAKISAEAWLEVHRQAHGLGLRSNATMLYGHLETAAQRVDHLLRLRALQDQTAGFNAFVPLSFVPAASIAARAAGLPTQSPSGLDDLKTVAVSRLMLDNFEHIKTFWVMHTLKLSQVALRFGADDVDGTVQQYEITPAGADIVDVARLEGVIRQAGCVPVQRDSLYRPIQTGQDGPKVIDH